MTRAVAGRIFSLAFAAATMLVAAGAFAAEASSLAPTTLPATARQSQIRQWFNELADTNPSVRESARVALMGVSVEELGLLRRIVEQTRPVAPAQATVLHDIVVHVYVDAIRVKLPEMEVELFHGDPYPSYRKSGFLGVLLEPMLSGQGLGLLPDEMVDLGPFSGGGVLIRETWPGFAGFRFLRVGDVVIGIGVIADAEAGRAVPEGRVQPPPARPPTVSDLKAAVTATAPGQTLELQVLRQGRVVTIPVSVTHRPPWAQEEITTRQTQSRRLAKAERYWNFAFRPLLADDGGGMS